MRQKAAAWTLEYFIVAERHNRLILLCADPWYLLCHCLLRDGSQQPYENQGYEMEVRLAAEHEQLQ